MLINKILCMRKILFILLIITMAGCSSKKKDLFEVITYECKQKEESLNLQFEFRGGVELPLEKICDSYKSLQDSIISVMFGEELVDYPTKKHCVCMLILLLLNIKRYMRRFLTMHKA